MNAPTNFVPVKVHMTGREPVEVTGEQVTEHFALTPMLTTDMTGASILTEALALTHIPTGRRVTNWGHDLRQLARSLQELPIDWGNLEKPTEEQTALVVGVLQQAVAADDQNGWPWPEWAGDEAQPATSLLAHLLDGALPSFDRFRAASDLGKEARGLLPAELGRKVDATLIASASSITVNEYGVIYLLAVLQRVDPAAADRAAHDLASAWDAGDSLGEWVWQWRNELAEGRPLTLHDFPELGPAITGTEG